MKADKKGIINNFILETEEGTDAEIIHRIKSALFNINIPNDFTLITKEYMITQGKIYMLMKNTH